MPYITDEEYQQFQDLKFIQSEIHRVQDAWKESAKHADNPDEAQLRGQGQSYLMDCKFVGVKPWRSNFPMVIDSQISAINFFSFYDKAILPKALWESVERELSKNTNGDLIEYLSKLDGWEFEPIEYEHQFYKGGDFINSLHGFDFNSTSDLTSPLSYVSQGKED